uniref:Uncharacterized protein n=1 Tax=Lepeophtheirus salmonis TaxID=72036 RepID=A0A0K2THZ7_LEPSM
MFLRSINCESVMRERALCFPFKNIIFSMTIL